MSTANLLWFLTASLLVWLTGHLYSHTSGRIEAATRQLSARDDGRQSRPATTDVLQPVVIALLFMLLPAAAITSFPEGQLRMVLVSTSAIVYAFGVAGVSIVWMAVRKRRLNGEQRWKRWNLVRTVCAFLSVALLLLAAVSGFRHPANTGACVYTDNTVCGYASIGELNMYYEVHGQPQDKPPLVLLHGQFATAGMFFNLVPKLVESRQVILVEQQGHGHTADIDRPLRASYMADDTAALLDHLGIEQADIFGYSDGGSVALQLAVRHPDRVHRLLLASAVYHLDGYKPGAIKQLDNMSANFLPPMIRESYIRVAPDPNGLDKLVNKSKDRLQHPENLNPAQLEAIQVPAYVVAGDNDIIRTEHTRELAQLLGTDAVIVSGNHASYIVNEPEPLLNSVLAFLNP